MSFTGSTSIAVPWLYAEERATYERLQRSHNLWEFFSLNLREIFLLSVLCNGLDLSQLLKIDFYLNFLCNGTQDFFLLRKATAEKLSHFIAKKFQFQIWHFVQESQLELISGMDPKFTRRLSWLYVFNTFTLCEWCNLWSILLITSFTYLIFYLFIHLFFMLFIYLHVCLFIHLFI